MYTDMSNKTVEYSRIFCLGDTSWFLLLQSRLRATCS